MQLARASHSPLQQRSKPALLSIGIHTLRLCARRAPKLKKFFLDLCATTEEALAVIQRLTSDLLDSDENKLGWRSRISTLESRLEDRLPSLEAASRNAQDVEGEQRALKIAHAIGKEAVRLQNAPSGRRNANGENDGLHTLHDDEIKAAILSESYRDCEHDRRYDLSTLPPPRVGEKSSRHAPCQATHSSSGSCSGAQRNWRVVADYSH